MKFLLALTLSLVPTFASAQVPNQAHIVRELFSGFDVAANTGAFTDAVICKLNSIDSKWGNLRKNPGQTQIHGHAEDAALYLVNGGLSVAVDFIGGAGSPNPSPGWIVDAPRYAESDWLPPHNCGVVVAPPGPTPPNPVPPATVDLTPLVGRLDRLEVALAELSLAVASVGATTRQIADRVEMVLVSNDRIIRQMLVPPDYKGGLFGVPVTLRPVVKPVEVK